MKGRIYFLNFFSKTFFTTSLKKKLPIEYKTNVPIEIEISEATVPNHWPKIIPEIINNGKPNPSKAIKLVKK